MFILLASGMFSFSSAAAQCVCYCSSDNQPRYNAECYTKANGNTGCRHTRCRDGIAGEQDIKTLTVPFYGRQTENVSLRILDVNGRLVTTLPDEYFEEGDNEIEWNVAELNSGMYFLEVETAGYSKNHKVIMVK